MKFIDLKNSSFTLNNNEMKKIKGGGTCAYINTIDGGGMCNLTADEAQFMAVGIEGNYWCCDSCLQSTWYADLCL